MRPLRLELEGFTCYRDRQAPLDFTGFSLFAIAGPTGAGKSTVLDAMLYALYGVVPRLGRQNVAEFISHGRDALSVCLDFALNGSRYRVTRRLRRGRKGTVQSLAMLAAVGETEQSLADGVKPVNEHVEGLLGLDYASFTQTVILPQNEFARFLQSDPRNQRAILQHLLRHHVFERMRAEAEKRRGLLDAAVQELERQLDGYGHATRVALESAARELEERRAARAGALGARQRAEAALHETRRRRQLTEERDRARAALTALREQAPEIEQERAELSAARRVEPLLPRVQAAAEARRAAAKACGAHAEADRASRDRAARSQAASDAARRATAAAAECDGLRDRIRRLDELKGDVQRRAVLADERTRTQHEVSATRAAVERAARARRAAERARRTAVAEAHRTRAELDNAPFDRALYDLLERLAGEVAQVDALDREIAQLEGDVSAHEGERARLDDAHEAAQRASAEAGDVLRRATLAVRAATDALEAGRRRHAAAALRAQLHEGDRCPVCLQDVASLPAVEHPPELAELEAALDRAAEEERRTAGALRDAAVARAAAEATRAERGAVCADARRRLEARTRARSETIAHLAAQLAVSRAAAPVEDIVSWVRGEMSALRAARRRREEREQALHEARTRAESAERVLLGATGEAARASERDARATELAEACAREAETIAARIAAVTVSADPSAERARLAERVTCLERAERDATAVSIRLIQEAVAAAAALDAAAKARAQADAEVERTAEALARAVAAAGFASIEAALRAERTRPQQSAIEARLATFDGQLAAVTARIAELEPSIGGREVDAAALAAAERAFEAAESAAADAVEATTRADAAHARLAHDVERHDALARDRAARAERLAVTAGLAIDLKGDRFQEFLLEESFAGLVRGASARMLEMSARYALDWRDGCFYVIDHDNASERRRAETLSGGETFMASLCLALQLGEEVLQSSGALRMDSLFIDEGFGTLDSQALADVTDAMEALRQDGDRLVGVISHRAELTDRLPGCIRIEKGAGESRWHVERVG